jgi:hypothetical protein
MPEETSVFIHYQLQLYHSALRFKILRYYNYYLIVVSFASSKYMHSILEKTVGPERLLI